MRNDIYNYVTSLSSLIKLPLRRTFVRPVRYSTLIVLRRDKACLVSTKNSPFTIDHLRS